MKVRFICYILLIPLFIFGNEEEYFREIVKKKCSQKIENFISYESNNTNICNFEYINQFPKEAQRKIKRLENDINNLKSDKLSIENKIKIEELEKKSFKIREDYALYKEIIDAIQKSRQNRTFYVDNQLNELIKEYSSLDKIIGNIEIQLRDLIIASKEKDTEQDGRIEKIEAKNREQDKALKKAWNYILNFDDISIGIDGLYPNQLDCGLNIEFEDYNTTTQSSNFLKLSAFKLREITNYTTLGNNIEHIDNDKNLYSIDFGYRNFFDSHRFIKKSNIYWGASLGVTYINDNKEKDTTGSASLLVGLEYNNRLISELGCKYLYEVSSKNINFDGLGQNNISSSSEKKFIPFISIKLLWR